jgi:hypothetical protein
LSSFGTALADPDWKFHSSAPWHSTKCEFSSWGANAPTGANASTGFVLQRMNAPDGGWVSCSRIPSHLLENKTLAARDKVPQNASLIDAKCEPTPAGRNMLFHPSMVRNPPVPCCRRSAPAARQVQSGRFQRQKLGKTCLLLALKCWRGTSNSPLKRQDAQLINSEI